MRVENNFSFEVDIIMDNRPIGLLDSGDGGFSVVKKVIKKLPEESTIFIGDNANMPYGNKKKYQKLKR